MVGVITSWEFSPTRSRPFGNLDGESSSGLSAPGRADHFSHCLAMPVARCAASKVPTILERCIGLELRAKRIYKALAKAFDDQGLVGVFFAGLADQEQYHADLLDVCRTAALIAAEGQPLQSLAGLSAPA